MSPELTRRIVQHLLSERALLTGMMSEFELSSDEEDLVSKCEQLLIDIQKETHGHKQTQPEAAPEGAGGNGQ